MKTKTIITVVFALLGTAIYAQNKLQSDESFENGLETWGYGSWGEDGDKPSGFITAEKAGQGDTGSVRVQVDKATENPNKMFVRTLGVRVEKGKEYTLSFWVKSDAPDSSVNVQLYSSFQTGSFKPWGSILSKKVPIEGTDKWEKVTLDFIATEENTESPVDYDAVALSFGFSEHTGTHYLDNVVVEEKI